MVDSTAGRPWRRRWRPGAAARAAAAAAGGVAAKKAPRAARPPSVPAARSAPPAASLPFDPFPSSQTAAAARAAAAGRRWRWGLHGARSGLHRPLAARRCWLRTSVKRGASPRTRRIRTPTQVWEQIRSCCYGGRARRCRRCGARCPPAVGASPTLRTRPSSRPASTTGALSYCASRVAAAAEVAAPAAAAANPSCLVPRAAAALSRTSSLLRGRRRRRAACWRAPATNASSRCTE